MLKVTLLAASKRKSPYMAKLSSSEGQGQMELHVYADKKEQGHSEKMRSVLTRKVVKSTEEKELHSQIKQMPQRDK